MLSNDATIDFIREKISHLSVIEVNGSDTKRNEINIYDRSKKPGSFNNKEPCLFLPDLDTMPIWLRDILFYKNFDLIIEINKNGRVSWEGYKIEIPPLNTIKVQSAGIPLIQKNADALLKF